MAENKPDKKVFDIAKPGESKPDIGSKPMIIGHKTMKSDPMVKDEGIKSTEEKKTMTSGKKIQPLSDKEKQGENMSQAQEPVKNEAVTADTVEDEKNEPSVLKQSTNNDEVEAEQVTEKTKEAHEKEKSIDPTALAMEREDNLKKIVETQQYFVEVKERSNSSVGAFLISFLAVVLLGVIAIFLLIDTGTVETDYELPFRIFGS